MHKRILANEVERPTNHRDISPANSAYQKSWNHANHGNIVVCVIVNCCPLLQKMERLYDLLIHMRGFNLKMVIRKVSNWPYTAMTNLMENALVLDLCMAQNILSLLGQSLDWIVGPEYSFSVFLT